MISTLQFTRKSLLLSVFSLPFFVMLATADTYDMVKEYAGTNFFDEWTFYDHCELEVYFNPYRANFSSR